MSSGIFVNWFVPKFNSTILVHVPMSVTQTMKDDIWTFTNFVAQKFSSYTLGLGFSKSLRTILGDTSGLSLYHSWIKLGKYKFNMEMFPW